MRPGFIIAGIVVAALVIATLTYWTDLREMLDPAEPEAEIVDDPSVAEPVAGSNGPPSAVKEDAMTPLPAPETAAIEPEPEIELPPLEESDPLVIERLAQWPIPPAWLEQEQLVARLAVFIQNGAAGNIPKRQLAFLAPSGAPKIVERDGRMYLAPANFERFDPHMRVLEAVPVTDAVEFVRLIEPLLQSGLAQVGDRRSVRALISDLIATLEATPQPPAEIEVVRPNVLYEFADPALEKAPALQKQALRIGPQNYSKLMKYLSEFKELYFE